MIPIFIADLEKKFPNAYISITVDFDKFQSSSDIKIKYWLHIDAEEKIFRQRFDNFDSLKRYIYGVIGDNLADRIEAIMENNEE